MFSGRVLGGAPRWVGGHWAGWPVLVQA